MEPSSERQSGVTAQLLATCRLNSAKGLDAGQTFRACPFGSYHRRVAARSNYGRSPADGLTQQLLGVADRSGALTSATADTQSPR
jgi:hypothetical protein